MRDFHERGWEVFDAPSLLPWIDAARDASLALLRDPEEKAKWLRHGGTWYAGVNALPNSETGAVPGGPPLPRDVVARAWARHGSTPVWDAGQVSVVYPGYPQQDETETDAAHRFRRVRDAAHVDGLLPVGPDRRRKMEEPHGFVLGIPLNECGADASPIVIWEGSHGIMRGAFAGALEGIPEEHWADVDLTDVYQTARRRCFETCKRVPVIARPGQAYILHRLALHGVAPWAEGAVAPSEGRMIVYFRPAFRPVVPGETWIDAP